MKLATLAAGTPDGRLVVVSRDLKRAANAAGIAPTLQEALDRWSETEPKLRDLFARLEAGSAESFAFDPSQAWAPLPRAWQWLDGSTFPAHSVLMERVLNINPEKTGRPLMYQGVSSRFLSGTADVPLPSEADGMDFEGEFGIITDFVPMGVSAQDALRHIKLVVQINDWSLRNLGRAEMNTGFGWIRAKPVCSMAPVAVTPDELGPAWENARVCLPLLVDWNGKRFGAANGAAMEFGFQDLIAHAAYSRDLCAGTVVGSGTVSNENYREVGSSCIAERRGIELIDTGASKTEFMRFGDRVRMEALARDGSSLFGVIDQKIVKAHP